MLPRHGAVVCLFVAHYQANQLTRGGRVSRGGWRGILPTASVRRVCYDVPPCRESQRDSKTEAEKKRAKVPSSTAILDQRKGVTSPFASCRALEYALCLVLAEICGRVVEPLKPEAGGNLVLFV